MTGREDKNLNTANHELIRVNNYELNVRRRMAKLLYISDEEPESIPFGLGPGLTLTIDFSDDGKPLSIPKHDLSTIFVKLPISKPQFPEQVPYPQYFPIYAGLRPDQKWIYLNWLKDISQPIDIGYVFLYYYGLERQLLIGEFDLAVDEIIYLRKHHDNKSFTQYTNSALLTSCNIRRRNDRLKDVWPLVEKGELENIELLIAYRLGFDLNTKSLLSISKHIPKINKRYLKSEPNLFEYTLRNCLKERYKADTFPFSSKHKLEDVSQTAHKLFCNMSFAPDLRNGKLPNFFFYQPFADEVREVFKDAHERIKIVHKKSSRNKNKKGI